MCSPAIVPWKGAGEKINSDSHVPAGRKRRKTYPSSPLGGGPGGLGRWGRLGLWCFLLPSRRALRRPARSGLGRQRGRCADIDVFTFSRRRENRAKARRKSRGDADQTCRCPSIGRHRAVVPVTVRFRGSRLGRRTTRYRTQWRNGSFSTEMVKAQARTCPLQSDIDRQPSKRDPALRAMSGHCNHAARPHNRSAPER